MKISFHAWTGWLALVAMLGTGAAAETRMQVATASASVHTRPAGDSQQLGQAAVGEILFVSRTENAWVAIAPPDRIDLWINKDFLEGNRVVANNIQIRSGPGIQYDIVGTLARGAPVMPRGEDGDWCKIAPPSSAILWVRQSDLSEVRTPSTPIREVATVPPPAPPSPPPLPAVPAEKPSPPPVAAAPAPAPEPVPTPVAESTPEPARKVAPSIPQAAAPKPASDPATPAPPPVMAAAAPARPVPAPARAPATPIAKPRPERAPVAPSTEPPSEPVATPVATPRPPATPVGQPRPTATAKTVPAPDSAVTGQKSRDLSVSVDPQLVEDLDLAEGMPNQGQSVQVEGELRNAPFLAASPSRYRLLNKDADGMLEMVCHVHGDSNVLRQYIGKGVSIRGREYWVDSSDMPVVVVGQIVPLAPAFEPVMF